MRAEALATANRDRRNEGNLPTFAEHEREHIPLNTMTDDYEDVDDKQQYHPRFASTTDVGAPSIISGVGEGYGRRNPAAPGLPVSFSGTGASLVSPSADAPPHSPTMAIGGVGSRLGAEARANRGRATSTDQDRLYSAQRQGSQTTEPFQGMYDQPQQQQYDQQYGQGYQQQQQQYHDPYQQSTSPPPQQSYTSMPEPTVVSPTYSQHNGGAYPPYPSPGQGQGTVGASTIGSAYSQPTVVGGGGGYPSASTPYGALPSSDSKQNFSYPTSSSPPPQHQQQYQPYSQPQQQNFHLHNQTTGDGASIAPTYYTNEPQQGSYGGNGTYGHQQQQAPPMPNPHSPTYGGGGGNGADAYGVPYGSSGAQRY